MIDNINALKTSWYLSPPWGQTIPPVAVNLLSDRSLLKYRARERKTLFASDRKKYWR
jgi:hypothetical protein